MTRTTARNPWRYSPGDHVYVHGHPQEPAVITAAAGRGRFSWPHYFLVDSDGHEWCVPQIHLSSSPI